MITSEEAAAHLHLSAGSPTLSAFVAAAKAAIERRIGPVEDATVTERVQGGSSLLLRWPTARNLTVSRVGGATLPTEGLSVRHGVVYGPSAFGGSYDVTYTAGYGTGTGIPADLKLAALELVRHFWDTQRGNSPAAGGALPDDQMPGMSLDMYDALPRRVEQLLAPYLRVLV